MKKKKITMDLFYSITAVGMMNAVLQLIVFPVVNSRIGEQAFGEALFWLGVLNILAPSFGIAVNNTRLLLHGRDSASNKDFLLVLGIFSGASAMITACVAFIRGAALPGILPVIYIIMAAIFRNYSSVEYRLSLNYKKQFLFYAILSAGYVAGTGLFLLSGAWAWPYVIGETGAVLFVAFSGRIYKDLGRYSSKQKPILKNSVTLSGNYLLTNAMLNLDRIVLLRFVGNEAVSQYYVLSLMGKTIAMISGPLNGILIGYLTKDGKRISKRTFLRATALMLGVGFVFWAGCSVATPIFVKIMYPNLYGTDAMSLNLIVNMGQIFYFLSGILVVITLTVSQAKRILYVQIGYSALFAALSVVMTMSWGLKGFAFAALTANMAYFVLVFLLGVYELRGKHNITP